MGWGRGWGDEEVLFWARASVCGGVLNADPSKYIYGLDSGDGVAFWFV